jgi:hypothetical protein
MIVVRSIAHKGEYIQMKFFCIVKMGKKFPSNRDTCSLNSKCGNDIFNFRRRCDSENIKKEEKRKNRDEEHSISEKKDNKTQQKG